LQDKDFGSLALTNAIKELDRLKLHCVGHIHGIENNIVNNGKYTTINSAEKVVYYEYK
jgi:Icc-related predicted phosphoesterase